MQTALLEQAILRAKYARGTPRAVIERQQKAPVPKAYVPTWHFIVDENMTRVGKTKRIISAVCAHFGVDVGDLKSRNQHAYIVYPRHIAMHAAKKFTKASLPELGRRFGDRDHTTVLHAYLKIERLQIDDRVAADCEDIARAIGEAI